MNKKELSEQDIITKFVLPAITRPAVGWDLQEQIRQEYVLTPDRITTQGRNGEVRIPNTRKRADIVLFHKPNVPLAVIEAKDNNNGVGEGIQQAVQYAKMLDVPFAYSTNGDAFVENDRSDPTNAIERHVAIDAFPKPAELWARYCRARNINPEQEPIVAQDWFVGTEDGSDLSLPTGRSLTQQEAYSLVCALKSEWFYHWLQAPSG